MTLEISTQNHAAPITIWGHTYQGISQLERRKKGTEIIRIPDGGKFYIYQDCYGMYVLSWAELFPCFDIYDRMSESRFYRRYMVCQTQQEALDKYQYYVDNKLSMYKFDESLAPLAPIVLADDERLEIQIMMDQNLHAKPIHEPRVKGKWCGWVSQWFRW